MIFSLLTKILIGSLKAFSESYTITSGKVAEKKHTYVAGSIFPIISLIYSMKP